MDRVIYQTSITKVGAGAPDFLEERMLIFFREDAPSCLAEFCYLIGPGEGGCDIQVGDQLVLDGVRCPITAIGETALESFRQLGHLTVRFDGADLAAQPGTMHVRQSAIPPLSAGTDVRFLRVR